MASSGLLKGPTHTEPSHWAPGREKVAGSEAARSCEGKCLGAETGRRTAETTGPRTVGTHLLMKDLQEATGNKCIDASSSWRYY